MITTNLITINSGDVYNLSEGYDAGFDITIQNVGITPIYIGGDSEVNPEYFGYRIDPNTAFSIELSGQDDIWAYSDDNNGQIAVLRAHLEVGK